jgi:hypothetical protein
MGWYAFWVVLLGFSLVGRGVMQESEFAVKLPNNQKNGLFNIHDIL